MCVCACLHSICTFTSYILKGTCFRHITLNSSFYKYCDCMSLECTFAFITFVTTAHTVLCIYSQPVNTSSIEHVLNIHIRSVHLPHYFNMVHNKCFTIVCVQLCADRINSLKHSFHYSLYTDSPPYSGHTVVLLPTPGWICMVARGGFCCHSSSPLHDH